MSNVAKGSFPGCLRRKIGKKVVKNFNHRVVGKKWENIINITEEVKRRLEKFHKIFGDSDEDEDFRGFSSEECGLIAYKRIASCRAVVPVPDILCSPVDLSKKNVTTRLAHARRSFDVMSDKSKRRRKKLKEHDSDWKMKLSSENQDSDDTSSDSSGFTKYTNSNLDFHRLSENASLSRSAPPTGRQSSLKHKKSPIKPATFIAPSLVSHDKRRVTNITPTCLKIKMNPEDEAGPGHPQVLAKALLARANKRGKKYKNSHDLPLHTSTPIGATVKSKPRSFVLPTKSSRSSRIIKANPRYIDSDSESSKDTTVPSSPVQSSSKAQFSKSKEDSSTKGRLLLKEPTFRVAALASINNKPQTSRLLDKRADTRDRARKLIKRAKFKHPTSSSTLVVGNDFEDSADRKKNLIKEATFKMPSKSKGMMDSKRSDFSDLGLSQQTWDVLAENELDCEEKAPAWTRQEIHNLLHGAHTFASSWTRVAKHYEYHPLHRNWQSVKSKLKTLQSYGLLSENWKVKSSILLQLKYRYSENPDEAIPTPRVRASRRMANDKYAEDFDNDSDDFEDVKQDPAALRKHHIEKYHRWSDSLSTDSLDTSSIYLGLDEDIFMSLCLPHSDNKKVSWSVREIHNIIHGVHIFGTGEWASIQSKYVFQKLHNSVDIRLKYKSISSKKLIVKGEVAEEVLVFLQPSLSAAGKKYFELSARKGRVSNPKNVKRQPLVEVAKKNEKSSTKKKASTEDADLKSPPRKQAYHLFGTAPVWDDSSASGVQSIEGTSSDTELNRPNQELSAKNPCGRSRKESIGSSSSHKQKDIDYFDNANSKCSRGPRIKHVCRRASLVTGYKRAVFSDDGCDLHLSALPKKERERIAAEVEKQKGVPSDTTASTDSESEVKSVVKSSSKKKEKVLKSVSKKRIDQTSSKIRYGVCGVCKNCKAPNCGNCRHCKDQSSENGCLSRLPCLNPPASMKDKKSQANHKAVSATSHSEAGQDIQKLSKSSANTGVILSPDSRRLLQLERQERSRQSLSIVKIDGWKEKYELDDLWDTGGVSIISSITPSTRFLCFLCGSAGRARPMRRLSEESDSSVESAQCYDHRPLFIFCCSCCEPFHPFCLEDYEQQLAINAAKEGNWICKRCQFCNVCGQTDDLLECKRCSKTYHSACLGPGYPTKRSENRVWVCMRCVRCRSCGASKPGRRPGSNWTHDFQLCQRCGDLFDKGNYCPICRRCYRDEDYESRMVQCATCKRWVHSRCENLTNEMYALLSHLPDDVQYVCPDCDGRRTTVEIEYATNDHTITDDSSNDNSFEGEKMRSLLRKLPSPPWKKILENEVQSGMESVTMALFHNKDAACILKKSVEQEECGANRPVDLFAVRFAVHNHRYTSVGEFSSDVCYIMDTVSDLSSTDDEVGHQNKKKKITESGPRAAFSMEMHRVFPWFDVKTGRVRDTSDVPEDLLPHATLPPYSDHNYAQWQDRDIDMSVVGPETPLKNATSDNPPTEDTFGMVVWSVTPNKEDFSDRRLCLFCGKYGDDFPTNAGRLTYCGQDEWVHVNCALWSAEVFERHDGSLQNVYSAVSRGRMMKCEYCKLPGATVGCNTRDCPQNYHFVCAKLAHCSFQDDKKVFCPKHMINIDSQLVPEEGFEVDRRVVVDNDEMRPNKRWQRGVQSDNVTILMGSAIIHQLGHLTIASDNKEFLIPIHFRMTRMFWSTVHAGRKVKYKITVTEQASTPNGTLRPKGTNASKKSDFHENHTISHADEGESMNASDTVKSQYLGAASCKSKLIDRLQSLKPRNKGRKKSQDEQTLKSPRSKRSAGSTYSVIGSINRTLPQNITPLPSKLKHSIATNSENTNTVMNHESPKPTAKTLFNQDFEKGAVKISHTNPYLNIQIGSLSQHSTEQNTIIQPAVLKAMDKCLAEAYQLEHRKLPASHSLHSENGKSALNSGSSGSTLHGSTVPDKLTVKLHESLFSSNSAAVTSSLLDSVVNASSNKPVVISSTFCSKLVEETHEKPPPTSKSQDTDVSHDQAENDRDKNIEASQHQPFEQSLSSSQNNVLANENVSASVHALENHENGELSQIDGKGHCISEDTAVVKSCRSHKVSSSPIQSPPAENVYNLEPVTVDQVEQVSKAETNDDSKISSVSPKPKLIHNAEVVDPVSNSQSTDLQISKKDSEREVSTLRLLQQDKMANISVTPCDGTSSSNIKYLDVNKSEEAQESEPSTIGLLQQAHNIKTSENTGNTCTAKSSDMDQSEKGRTSETCTISLLQKAKKAHNFKTGTNSNGVSRIHYLDIDKSNDPSETELPTIGLLQQAKKAHDCESVVISSQQGKKTEVKAGSSVSSRSEATSNLWWKKNKSIGNKAKHKASSKRKSKDKDGLEEYQENSIFSKPSFSKKTLTVVLRDVNNSEKALNHSMDEQKSGCCPMENQVNEDASKYLGVDKDELFTKTPISADCDSSSIDSSSISDAQASQNENISKMYSRKKKLRNFAKDLNIGEKGMVSRSSSRRFSHDATLPASKDGPAKRARLRSQSVECSAKMRQSSDQTSSPMDDSKKRYPRRNPFTCLKSFSGLSPDYAIKSYSSKSQERLERARNRSTRKCNIKKRRNSSGCSSQKSVSGSSDDNSSVLPTENESFTPKSSKRPAKKRLMIKSRSRLKTKTSSSSKTDSSIKSSTLEKDPRIKNRRKIPGHGRLGARSSRLSKSPKDKISSQRFLEKLDSVIRNKRNCDITCKQTFSSNSPDVNCGVAIEKLPNIEEKCIYSAEVDIIQGNLTVKKRVEEITSKDLTLGIEGQAEDSHEISSSEKLTTDLNDSLPAIEDTRGIIEVRTPDPPQVSMDSSNSTAMKPNSISQSPLNVSPVLVPHVMKTPEQSISKDNSAISNLTISTPVLPPRQTIPMSAGDKLKSFAEKSIHDTRPVPAVQSVAKVIARPLSDNFRSAIDDIDSPLSPRDEQRLPLPVETEATASSFLVTSECPVLNADEVQSILAMPTNTVTSSTPIMPSHHTLQIPQMQTIRTTPSLPPQTVSYYTPRSHIPSQYVNINVQKQVTSYQPSSNVVMNYGGKSAYVLYERQPVADSPVIRNTPTQTIITSTPVSTPAVKVCQPQLAYQYVQPQLVYGSPVIRSPALVQQTMYVATPVIQTVGGMAVAIPQTSSGSYTVAPKVTPQYHGPGPRKHDMNRTNTLKTTPSTLPVLKKRKSSETILKSNTIKEQSDTFWTSSVTPDQVSTLEKMIEYYSNKNNLSNNEKQIVRAIIAQQIQNKSLPLPTPDGDQAVDVPSSKVNTDKGRVASVKRKSNAPSPECIPKKQRKSSKKSKKALSDAAQENLGLEHTPKHYSESSPLLDVYMEALHAENSSDSKLLKKWRTIVRSLSKRDIHLDVPWYSRRGGRDKENKLPPPPPASKNSEIVYEITSEDGYHAKGSDLKELVSNLLDAVQECRSNAYTPPSSLCLASVISPHAFLGVSHDAVRFLVEQLPGARHCQRYRPKYHKQKESIPEVVTHINPHGCARAEKFQGRSKPDMFSFLASKHRVPPSYDPSLTQNIDMQQNSTRRPTSMDLPMAMRFRHLKTSAREAVGVYRSAIHGRGLFCKRDIEAGEMVMEYTGEAIRSFLTDRREKMYETKGIGCYMFRMDDMYVVDATVMGSGARFINHSCEPSCFSRIVSIDGKKHIIIFALRKILRGEELTYDYKFPIEAEDQKIMCNCGSKLCRKYMN